MSHAVMKKTWLDQIRFNWFEQLLPEQIIVGVCGLMAGNFGKVIDQCAEVACFKRHAHLDGHLGNIARYPMI